MLASGPFQAAIIDSTGTLQAAAIMQGPNTYMMTYTSPSSANTFQITALAGGGSITLTQATFKQLKYVPGTTTISLCNQSNDNYRFGFNGQEKNNQWAGIGNHMTALYWEFDTRTGKRLNRDPIFKYSESPYVGLGDNPIYLKDPLGNDSISAASVNKIPDHSKNEYATGEISNKDNDLTYADNPKSPSSLVTAYKNVRSNGALESNYEIGTYIGTGTSEKTIGDEFINHFYSGKGGTLVYKNQSSLSNLVMADERFQHVANKFESAAREFYKKNGTMNGFEGDKYLSKPDFSGTQNMTLWALIGGTQRVEAQITHIQMAKDGTIAMNVQYRIYDAYGAGTSDGKRWLIPGLQSMYTLQHYRNGNTHSKYVPFILRVDVANFSKGK